MEHARMGTPTLRGSICAMNKWALLTFVALALFALFVQQSYAPHFFDQDCWTKALMGRVENVPLSGSESFATETPASVSIGPNSVGFSISFFECIRRGWNILLPASEQPIPISDAPVEYHLMSTDTSSWKTYRNEQYRFEIKYPPTWRAVESKPSKDVSLYVGFQDTSRSSEGVKMMSLNIFKDARFVDVYASQPAIFRRLIINGMPAFGQPTQNFALDYELYFEHAGNVYVLESDFPAGPELKNIEEPIVGTLKFF
jgi:hypothetical protein